ncbi:MAG: hypothetical protein KDC43_00225 [Saprospiraceae bacterium]|nr:hypothetical protein [Saprospiraceae bacterium]MCB0622366.1 hypothetical protein [Saprospiraceae bacterium]MCB0675919.1 hypothetical protein [Saprospiraceae bacterium]MCB0682490.1 hypothetical protein [Saprospiraceae bacterium]
MKKTLLFSLLLGLTFQLSAQIGGWDPRDRQEKAEEAIEAFLDKDPSLQDFFDAAYGFVVFPSIGKGGMGVGGAHGKGVAYERGEIIGQARVTQVTVGFQFGGQAYSEVIFFENRSDLERFKNSQLELAAQASAVAVKTGASANVAYENGVAVFTMTKGGLMYEASIGGQKFKFIEE